ncbi:hypothetical protein BSL78_27402 [Apostichopus japonicus]|uniref:Uncharacterized protein n=1 Tax=Stichopus japonicus TaxID=307972 RepID=A0A2G8JJ50_STIJA|nr:hypothetical protein BSL78_27402 [Apostichopus japonicus]
MKNGPYRTFQKWAKVYGKTFCCQNRYDTGYITEDFKDMDFMSESFQRIMKVIRYTDDTIPKRICKSPLCNKWKAVRSFITSLLNASNVGKKTYDTIIASEFENVCSFIKENHRKESFNPKTLFTRSVANILIYTLFQKRYPYTGATADVEISAVETLAETLSIEMLFVIPSYIYILARMGYLPIKSIQKLVKASECLSKVCDENIIGHRKDLNEDEVRDVVDICLKQINETKATDEKSYLTENAVNGALTDMFSAGLVSTALMLTWTLLLVISNPEVKKRLAEEIASTVGFDRHPQLSDRDNMPYAKAVIQEALRFVSVAPIGVYHKVQEDTTFKGYFLPKNTMILPNIWGLHHDPEIFPEPDKFKPERFIDSKGQFMKDRRVAAFGIGK